jgi:hypothetical protein
MKTALFLFICFASLAQESFDLAEDRPETNNGIEYAYTIKNERNEDSYSRFEVSISAKNKSGCQLIYLKKSVVSSIFDGDPSALARFDCVNATGKRLTSKGGNLKARTFYVPYEVSEKTTDGKTRTTTVKVEGGYILKNGATVSNDFIVIVPKGERPKFKVRLKDFTELTAD